MVVACCRGAAGAGVRLDPRRGVDLAHARSQLPPGAALHIEAHRPRRVVAALGELACWALRFSPTVAVDVFGDDDLATGPRDSDGTPGPVRYGLVLDFSGTQRLYASESRAIRAVASALRVRGLCVRAAMAPTVACARALAWCGRHDLSCVPDGRQLEAMRLLPVEALGVDERVIDGFSELGVCTIEQVIAVPRRSLASRFGHRVIDRLDEALGSKLEIIDPVRPAPPLAAELLFDGPTDQAESVMAGARCVLEDLVDQLACRQRGVRRLELELMRPGQTPQDREVVALVLSRPSRNAKHLWSMLELQLERIDMAGTLRAVRALQRLHDARAMPGRASAPPRATHARRATGAVPTENVEVLGRGIEGLIITAVRTARLRYVQLRSDGSADDSGGPDAGACAGELIDVLTSRLGNEAVVRVCPAASHIPEHAFIVQPALDDPDAGDADADAPSGARRAGPSASANASASATAIVNAWPTASSLDRPTRLFENPEPATALSIAPDGPVYALQWRGRQWTIGRCIGPERISAEWWRWGAIPHDPAPLDPTTATTATATTASEPFHPAPRQSPGPPTPLGPPIPPADRDYFAMQTQHGRWLWVCRQVVEPSEPIKHTIGHQPTPRITRWLVHGEWS